MFFKQIPYVVKISCLHSLHLKISSQKISFKTVLFNFTKIMKVSINRNNIFRVWFGFGFLS